VGRTLNLLVLLGGEDINASEVNLGVTVLAGLGGGHVHDLAGLILEDNVHTLAEGRSLLGLAAFLLLVVGSLVVTLRPHIFY